MKQSGRTGANKLWGLILAGGEGIRLQELVQQLKGVALPKQFVNFIGRRSMFEHTFDRAEKLISADRLITIVSRHHLAHGAVRQQLASRPAHTLIVQPQNKETAAGILLPLVHLYKRSPEAIVAVFPSDHFILEEERFLGHVELAAHAVARDPTRIVLLAMEARWPETEYGYTVLGNEEDRRDLGGIRPVVRFVEKPDREQALGLLKNGGLWNTMIMVFKVKTLLDLVEKLCPEIYLHFDQILESIGTSSEHECIRRVYRRLKPINFSKGLLETASVLFPKKITALPVLEVTWSDWGSPQRLLQALLDFKRPEGFSLKNSVNLQSSGETAIDRSLTLSSHRGLIVGDPVPAE
jgi:mannose-1-phosphate guanylyltransferase